jgi:hypothetical protein
MSNHQHNTSESAKTSAGDEHKEQKVIVLSIKDMVRKKNVANFMKIAN